MNKEMRDRLFEITKETLAPELQKKDNTAEKIKAKSILANVYRYGDAPDDPELMLRKEHPKNAKKTVRFINQEGRLYFNMGDWLKPYKNKMFEKMVKATVKPPANKRLDQLWMWIDAWQIIESAVKKNKSALDVVKVWQSGRLF